MNALLWTAWAAFFVVYETITLLNRRDDDTLSENTRRLFRIRTSKAGRAIFTIALAGGSVWFLLHILTETM
ncbi:hypothetical protein OHS33_38785 (plasmid) [Streptomyces sp. NBC_00536]|uniref:hypothetical protein n=1 Tax=Streptomyces sp. NBC_00536 TaxID=2975769 RepID=UPI002E80F194|nr:hypothetical protein [Streptomyces sp. NBC_00536]WUC84450.1 hypothetical protein OHS33_38785 [Streptomyces sp. NBC_00536]